MNASHGSHRTLHKMTVHNTMFDSQHKSQLRSRHTPQPHDCCTAYLCRCRYPHVRFGNRDPLRRFSESLQLIKQFTDARTRRFVVTKLHWAVTRPFSKKLGLLVQKPCQFSAYLGLSFFVSWNIPSRHDGLLYDPFATPTIRENTYFAV